MYLMSYQKNKKCESILKCKNIKYVIQRPQKKHWFQENELSVSKKQEKQESKEKVLALHHGEN